MLNPPPRSLCFTLASFKKKERTERRWDGGSRKKGGVIIFVFIFFFLKGLWYEVEGGCRLIGGGGSTWQDDGSFHATVNDIKQ